MNSALIRTFLLILVAGQMTGCRTRLAIKHFYTDLDGTLLDENSEIPADNLAAIERFRAAGGGIGIATGRLPDRAIKYARAIGAQLPLIFANGAVITDPTGAVIRMEAIWDSDDVLALCAEVAKAGCTLVYTAWGNPKTEEVLVEMGACRPATSPSFGVLKIRARRCAGHDALLKQLPEVTRNTYSIVESGSGEYLGVSVAARGVQKAAALEFVAERLGIRLSAMGFVGDSGNDVLALDTMYRSGGLCFVMDNGTPSAKAACPHHTRRDNQQGGVAEVVTGLLRD
jgi:HAD superfamily hydrolase (TIGR01484 family)